MRGLVCTASPWGASRRETLSVYPRQDGQRFSQSFVTARRQQNPAPLVNKGSQDAAACAAALTRCDILLFLSFRQPLRVCHPAPSPLAARAAAYALHLRTAAACLSRCIRHWRRSKAKPVRGRSSAAGGSRSITALQFGNSSFGCLHIQNY